MALVLTLAILVIVTGVVIAFFTRATSDRQAENSRAQRQQADLLAQSAGNYVIGQFIQEIGASSSACTITTTTASSTTSQPCTSRSFLSSGSTLIAPQRILTSEQFRSALPIPTSYNLVVQSAPPSASGSSSGNPSDYYTTTPASDGRYIASKPLGHAGPYRHDQRPGAGSVPASDGFATQYSKNGAAVLPNWVYMTSNSIGGSSPADRDQYHWPFCLQCL